MTGPSMDDVCRAEQGILCGQRRHGRRCTAPRSGNVEQTGERQAAGYLLYQTNPTYGGRHERIPVHPGQRWGVTLRFQSRLEYDQTDGLATCASERRSAHVGESQWRVTIAVSTLPAAGCRGTLGESLTSDRWAAVLVGMDALPPSWWPWGHLAAWSV